MSSHVIATTTPALREAWAEYHTTCAYWSFQLGDVWSRSLDFMNRLSSLNDREINVDADGKVRVVVALKDPGVNNWMDPCGRAEGIANVKMSMNPFDDLKAYDGVSAARTDIADYVGWYNTARPHSCLDRFMAEQAYLSLLPKLAEAA